MRTEGEPRRREPERADAASGTAAPSDSAAPPPENVTTPQSPVESSAVPAGPASSGEPLFEGTAQAVRTVDEATGGGAPRGAPWDAVPLGEELHPGSSSYMGGPESAAAKRAETAARRSARDARGNAPIGKTLGKGWKSFWRRITGLGGSARTSR